MKKYQFLLLALIFLTSYSCQEKVDIEKEKAAIIEVLNGEGSAFAANDLEGVFALHVQDELAARLDGYRIYNMSLTINPSDGTMFRLHFLKSWMENGNFHLLLLCRHGLRNKSIPDWK